MVGEVDRQQVELHSPDWVAAQIESDLTAEAAEGLRAAGSGKSLEIYFGTWCSDSRRELARFWKALDLVQGEVGFDLRYIGVDEDKIRPEELVSDVDLLYVPTFVVREDGQEVGRIVEESPLGIELDLLSLLNGTAEGLITAKPELLEESTESDPG